jgi:serine/threonine protein kinase/Flp pilus assembly protein TadD
MKCFQCRAENPADTSYCRKCGARLGGASEAPLLRTLTASQPPPSPEGGKIIAGKYRLLAELGRGGMGRVFKAEDLPLDRIVAIKFLSPDLLGGPDHRARFIREARMASALNHPHICIIHEIGEEEEGTLFIAMEYIAGRSLREILRAGIPAVEDVVRFGRQIAEALQHAHDRGIIHRDLKSANVMISPEREVKVLDFGLAKRLTGGESEKAGLTENSITAAGTFLGTMHYAAPEVFRGNTADVRSDIWSLGVILFEMVAGKLPFDKPTVFALTSAILRDDPAPLPRRLPPRLRTIILKCLEKDPDKRYQRAAEVDADLAAFAAATDRSDRATSGRRLRSFTKVAAVIAVAGIIVLAGTWMLRNKRGLPSSPRASGSTVSTGGRASGVREANEYFERGMLFLNPQLNLAKGRTMLERSLELDPKFAEARAWYGFSFILEIDTGYSNDSSFLYKAEDQLKKALQDDPNTSRARSGLAALYLYLGQKERMLQELEKALEINPDELDANNWLGFYHILNGDNDSAEGLFRKILEKDALFFPARMNLGMILRMKGDSAGAIREYEKILEMDPRNPYALVNIAAVSIDVNDLPSARRRLEALPAEGQRNFDAEMTWAILLALEGKTAESRKTVDEDTFKYAGMNPASTLSAAQLFAVLGENQTALDWVERAVRNGDERIEWFQRNRLLAPLRDLPRFKQIRNSIMFRREQRALGGTHKR